MALQYLTLPDGSLPAGVSAESLTAAGVLIVRPTKPPVPTVDQVVRDTGDPTLTDGVYYQRWELVNSEITHKQKLVALNQTQRDLANSQAESPEPSGKLSRAIITVLLNEINSLRQWIVAFKAATAASTSLANLKTGVAALPNMPDRTLPQARTAITTAINAGTVDN